MKKNVRKVHCGAMLVCAYRFTRQVCSGLGELALMENERKSLPVSGVNAELPS